MCGPADATRRLRSFQDCWFPGFIFRAEDGIRDLEALWNRRSRSRGDSSSRLSKTLEPNIFMASLHPPESIAAGSPRRGASWANIVVGVQGPLVGLLLLCVVFTFTTNNAFLSLRNALNVLDQVTVLGILAIGMTAVIVSGGIDLSVGAILALSTMTMGWIARDFGAPFVVCIALGLLAGAVCGLVNGLLVTRARLP